MSRTGDADGLITNARFRCPRGLATDKSGNVYVADSASHTIRKISPAGIVCTIAGMAEEPGFVDNYGTAARFRFPYSLACDTVNNAIYVCDRDNHSIRKIDAQG